jgi:hypothetical protein
MIVPMLSCASSSRIAAIALIALAGCGDATVAGAEQLVEPGPHDASFDVALSFDGVDDYVTLGTARVPQIMRSQGIMFWFEAEAGASGGSEGGQVLFTLRRGDNSGIVVTLDDGVPHVYDAYAHDSLGRAPSAVSVGEWHHLAFVIDDDSTRLYVDGVDVAQEAPPQTKRTPTQAFIGSLDGFTHMFHGSFDELRLYDRLVSAQEIADAAAGKPPADTTAAAESLVMYLSFDESGGARSYDRSGLGNHAQLGDGVPELMPARVPSGVP